MTKGNARFIHLETSREHDVYNPTRYLVIGEFRAPLSLYINTWLFIGGALAVLAMTYMVITPNTGDLAGLEWKYLTENRFALWSVFGWWAAGTLVIGALVLVTNLIAAWAAEIRKYL